MGQNIENKKVLAIDFGASSGRAMLGTYADGKIKMQEIHRFSNDPVTVKGTMYWDVLRLFHEIRQSLIKAKAYGDISSIAVDTWGVDFGFLDQEGNLLENPVHYRDSRTEGMLEASKEYISSEELYAITGNQFMEINTLFQLLSVKKNRPEVWERVRTMLHMPDLFHYFLGAEPAADVSIASTSQMLDAVKKDWSARIKESFRLPEHLLPPVVPCGTVVGELSDELCEELDISKMKIIAVAGHDTQGALVATPAAEKDFIFLSCGTWSLLGTELDKPVIDENSLRLNITNESGYAGKTSFLKNIIGLWLVQESRRQWIREGKEYSFGELEALAADAEPFRSLIDPDDEIFVPAGNIPRRIREYCRETGQPIPETEGQIVRCINESLALKYRISLEEIITCTGKQYEAIYMIGGGVQSKLLCQLTANACKRRVSAGPVEATALGNASVQLLALGVIRDLEQARAIIRESEEIISYLPQDSEAWDTAYEKYKELMKC